MAIKRRIRLSIYRKWVSRFGSLKCYYCNDITYPFSDREHKKLTTLDHIIPVSKGGTNKQENIVISCKECNNKKGDTLITKNGDFKYYIYK